MILPEKIAHEEDPIAREIYALGYEKIEDDYVCDKIRLYKNRTHVKDIDRSSFMNLISSLQFIRGILPDGKTHKWVKEGDGSAQRLRDFIENS